MKITSIKTPIIKEGSNILEVISKNIKKFPEKSILAISAKIISICQGRIIKKRKNKKFEKYELIRRELSTI